MSGHWLDSAKKVYTELAELACTELASTELAELACTELAEVACTELAGTELAEVPFVSTSWTKSYTNFS